MAGPVVADAIKLITKAAVSLSMEPEKILQVILIIVFLPIAVLAVFFVAPAAMVQTVPMVEPVQVEYYMDAANDVNQQCGLEVDWQELLSLDAVLLEQDFSRSSPSRAMELAAAFVREEMEEVAESEVKPKVVYRQVSLNEVMTAYGLSSEQKNQVSMFLTMLGKGIAVTDVIPVGWKPNPKSRFIWPLADGQYAVTSLFGPRVLYGTAGFHLGLDIGAPRGTPILAADDGTVINTGWLGTAGRAVIIRHAGEYETRYCHLHSIHVKNGQNVVQGDTIGTVGSTGNSTGNHLHFEIRRRGTALDPLSFY